MHCDVLDSIGNEGSVVGGNQKQPENEATSDTQNTETISSCLTDTDASSTVDPIRDWKLLEVRKRKGRIFHQKRRKNRFFSCQTDF